MKPNGEAWVVAWNPKYGSELDQSASVDTAGLDKEEISWAISNPIKSFSPLWGARDVGPALSLTTGCGSGCG